MQVYTAMFAAVSHDLIDSLFVSIETAELVEMNDLLDWTEDAGDAANSSSWELSSSPCVPEGPHASLFDRWSRHLSSAPSHYDFL